MYRVLINWKFLIFITYLFNNKIKDRCYEDDKRFLCPNASCSKNYDSCKDKYAYCNDDSLTKCKNGSCKETCDILYNNCPFETPFHCHNGDCVLNEFECISFSCPIKKPFLCQDNICVKYMKECSEYNKLIIVEDSEFILDKNKNKKKFNNYNKEFLFNIGVTNYNKTEQITNSIEAISFVKFWENNNKYTAKKEFKLLYFKLFNHEFNYEKNKFDIFYSPIFKYTAKDSDLKNNKLYIDFKFNSISNDYNIYCLGKLINEQLKCVEYFDKNKNNFNNKKIRFNLKNSGVYSLIWNLNYSFKNNDIFKNRMFCGIICEYKVTFYKVIFLFLPLIMIIIIIFYKFYMLINKVINLKEENKFIKSKLKEIKDVNVDFNGQEVLEKLNEGINYVNNSLYNINSKDLEELKKINKQISKKKILFQNLKNEKMKLASKYKDKKETLNKIKYRITNMNK